MYLFGQGHQSLPTGEQTPPCISIYLPTHRSSPERLQDPIRFRNLIRQAENSLHERYPQTDAEALLAPFREIAENKEVWNNTLDGLAVLGAQGEMHIYPLRAKVDEMVLVGDRFHIKPLIGALEPTGRYHILALNLQSIRLFEGDGQSIREIDLDSSAPKTIDDALGDQLTEPYQTSSSNAKGMSSTYHGAGARRDEIDADAERFFRIVDRWTTEHYSRPSGFPLILAALTEHHALFRGVSKNPLLESEGIEVDPFALSLEEMNGRARVIIEHHRLKLEDEAVERFGTAYGQGNASGDVTEISRAAAAGRVVTLLLESDRRIRGKLNEDTGVVEYSNQTDAPDLLDQLVEMVVRKGGEILVLPAERMPVASGVAGIFRF